MDSVLLGIVSEEEERIKELKRFRGNIRKKFDPMSLPDNLFIKSFRLNKDAFKYVLGEIQDEIAPSVKCGLSPQEKLAACLRFFAEGNYQHGTAQGFDVSIAQSTFSKVLSEIIIILERKLCPKWIYLHMSEEEKRNAKFSFYQHAAFPGTIMCVDGTHVNIIAPKENKNLFYNRKGHYSLNVLIVCDHKQCIRFVDSRHQGANHDSHIWKISEARKFFEHCYRNGERGTWVLGDAGFPLEPWLMTPVRSAEEGSIQCNYNKKHAKARNIVERTIGVLKNRFLCLNNARRLHYSPEKASRIINVCCALHNICLSYNVIEPVRIPLIEEDDGDNIITENTSNISEAIEIRNSIINSF